MDIQWIRSQIGSGQYLWTLHADEERRNDGLEVVDVEVALVEGMILESYPADPRGISCLVYGESKGRSIHVVCGKNQAERLVIITVYKPTSPKWSTPKQRRTK